MATTQSRHHRLAYNCLRNKIQRYIKDRKNQYNQFVLSKLDSLSTSRSNFWKTVKDLFDKRSYSNAPLIRGDTFHYDMTSKANIFNEFFISISTAPDSIQSKILPRFHRCADLFIPPLLMFTMYYDLLILINRGFDNLPNRLLQKLRSISCHSFQSSLQIHPSHFSLPYSMENCVSNPTSQTGYCMM